MDAVTAMATASASSRPAAATPFAWLEDRRFGVWLPRLFWLLLIIEAFLWTNIGSSAGRLFAHGEIIAPVLFAASKAAMLAGAAHLLARLTPQAAGDRRQAVSGNTSALFLLWFAESLLHGASVLLVWLADTVLPQLQLPASNSWDLADLLLRGLEITGFEQPTAGYMLLTNVIYGLAAVLMLKLLAKRWPPRLSGPGAQPAVLPHWAYLLAGYTLVAVAHGSLMRLWVS
jgi:hypothetical protein